MERGCLQADHEQITRQVDELMRKPDSVIMVLLFQARNGEWHEAQWVTLPLYAKFIEFTDLSKRVNLPTKFYYSENQLLAMDQLAMELVYVCFGCEKKCSGEDCISHMKLNTAVYTVVWVITREHGNQTRDFKAKENRILEEKVERVNSLRREISWIDLFTHDKLGSSKKHQRIRRHIRNAYKNDKRRVKRARDRV